jgi:DNA-binding transcriptional ArsR family regulator
MPEHRPPPASTPRPAAGTWGHDEGPSELHLTADAIKVLAHPLRSRLVSQLRRSGPSTATELAALLGTNSGATSYHLRRLETVGLVADTGDGKGKERVWRAATEQHSWTPSELAGDEDAVTALNWLSRDYLHHFATKAEQWLDVEHAWPVEWVDQLGLNDNVALVTLEQMTAMRRELEEVLQRYRRVGQGNPQAKRIAVYTYAYPVDLDGSPRGDRR